MRSLSSGRSSEYERDDAVSHAVWLPQEPSSPGSLGMDLNWLRARYEDRGTADIGAGSSKVGGLLDIEGLALNEC